MYPNQCCCNWFMIFSITITYGWNPNYYPLQLHRLLECNDYKCFVNCVDYNYFSISLRCENRKGFCTRFLRPSNHSPACLEISEESHVRTLTLQVSCMASRYFRKPYSSKFSRHKNFVKRSKFVKLLIFVIKISWLLQNFVRDCCEALLWLWYRTVHNN